MGGRGGGGRRGHWGGMEGGVRWRKREGEQGQVWK